MSIKETMTDEEKAALADAGRILAQVCRTVDALDGRVDKLSQLIEELRTEQAERQDQIAELEAHIDALGGLMSKIAHPLAAVALKDPLGSVALAASLEDV